MFAARTLALFALWALTALAGCTQADLIRWQPTESQKRAADLAVQAADAMAAVAGETHGEIAATGRKATRATQTYIGLPAERTTLADPSAAATIDEAEADAADRPALTQGAQHALEKGLGWTEALLGLAGSIAGTWGVSKARRYVKDLRTKSRRTGRALKQTVDAVEDAFGRLDPRTAETLREALRRRQDAESKVAVSEAKHAA